MVECAFVIGAFRVDESRWPLVIVTFPPTVVIEEYRALFQQYVAMSKRGDKVAYLIDMQKFNPLTAPAAVRKAAAETFAENRHILVKATVCEARVVASSLTCGVLTAFDWLTGQKWPCANFTVMVEAERWAAAQLRTAGVERRVSA
jgi:hypothetical protein